MMRIRYAAALTVAAIFVARAQTDWPVYGHDPGGMRYSPLKQIDTKNVSKLEVAWTFDTQAPIPQSAVPGGNPAGAPAQPPGEVGAAGGRGRAGVVPPDSSATVASPGRGSGGAGAGPDGVPAGRGRGGRGAPRQRRSESTPLVIGGVMYLTTGYYRILALEPETGKKIWEYESPHPPALRGLAYWPGDSSLPPQIVFGTSNGWLISLNAKTGRPVPGFGVEGMVNLRPGVADKYPRAQYGMSSPPSIYKNFAITGSQVQEGPTKGTAGDIRAWDMRNGKLAWTFHTIPRPGEANYETWLPEQAEDRSGANAWGPLSVDTARGLVFAGVGQVTRDFDGADRKGLNLYGSSIVALDANTGKLKWYFQTTHHDNWDYDPTSPPALIDVVRRGRKIPAVALPTKAGLLFIWDRVTGKPIYEIEERPVLSDNPIPGDEPWPTQPFPVKPPPLSRNTFQPEEVAKVTPEHEKFCRALLETEGGALGGGPYAQYGPKLRVIFPSWIGGANWGGGSFDPKLGFFFVNMQNLGNLNKMVKSANGQTYSRVPPDDTSLGADSSLFIDVRNGYPCQQPPWGELSAVNVNTGDIAWRVPLGSVEELEAKGVPKTGTPNVGGPIATAGGLVFIGATSDSRFRAFDSKTGKELWSTKLNDIARTVPMTYQGKDGKQYVAVMAGGGGGPLAGGLNTGTGRLYVFKLP